MADKIRIGIGAPTYNSVERLENLLTSIEFYTDPADKAQCRIVVLDDGTPDLKKREGVKELAKKFGVDFIQHEKNEGIPVAWNSLTNHFKDIDYMILLNDDIQIASANWLKSFIYFMDNNPKVGSLGFAIRHIDPNTHLPNKQFPAPSEEGHPNRVGSPNGCSFGFRKGLWEKIINPDGSVGFYADLISFYEELDFNFEIAKLGYQTFQLVTPLLEHHGSLTFGLNQNLATRTIGTYISKEEYLTKLYENKKLWIPYEVHERLALKENKCFRMEYARMMFAKHWDCKDWINNPQAETHSRLIDNLPRITIKYLDKDLNERECEC